MCIVSHLLCDASKRHNKCCIARLKILFSSLSIVVIWMIYGKRFDEVWCIIFILRIMSSFFIFVVSWHICHLCTMHSVIYVIFYNIIVLSPYVKVIWLILMIHGGQGGVLSIFFLSLCLDNKITYGLGMVLYTFSSALGRQRQEELWIPGQPT